MYPRGPRSPSTRRGWLLVNPHKIRTSESAQEPQSRPREDHVSAIVLAYGQLVVAVPRRHVLAPRRQLGQHGRGGWFAGGRALQCSRQPVDPPAIRRYNTACCECAPLGRARRECPAPRPIGAAVQSAPHMRSFSFVRIGRSPEQIAGRSIRRSRWIRPRGPRLGSLIGGWKNSGSGGVGYAVQTVDNAGSGAVDLRPAGGSQT